MKPKTSNNEIFSNFQETCTEGTNQITNTFAFSGNTFPFSGNTGNTKIKKEIPNVLLELNNLDSASSIKDESLDIDLSACVPVPSAIFSCGNGGNSMSSDFWRLDESVQIASEADVVGLSTVQTSFQSQFICPEPPTPHPFSSQIKSSSLSTSPSEIHKNQLNKTKFKGERVKKSKTKTSKPKLISIALDLRSKQSKEVSPQNDTEFFKSTIEIDQQVAQDPILKYNHCDDFFNNLNELTINEVKSHKCIFKCEECCLQFENENELKKHIKTHKTLDARKDIRKKCPECGKCLKLGSMWMHKKIHSDNKKYACDICGQKFVQKINLTNHSRVHTSEKPFECPECQKRFQERSHLQRHQKYHAQTRSYRCDKCGKMYKTERCLKVHNLVHLEQRPFACQVCDKSFISNSKLKQHSNIHTGARPFKCNYCPRDFTNFPNWLKHTRRRHKVDHKTGEKLENIPSYCSKKSVAVSMKSKSTINADESNVKETKVKSPIKRKKKVTTLLTTTEEDVSISTSVNPIFKPSIEADNIKSENKSPSTPKEIKQEPYFYDLHCLSITSAEELIMEQALEMEECQGLYDAHNGQKHEMVPLVDYEINQIKQPFVRSTWKI